MKNPKLAALVSGAVAAFIIPLGGVAALHAAEPPLVRRDLSEVSRVADQGDQAVFQSILQKENVKKTLCVHAQDALPQPPQPVLQPATDSFLPGFVQVRTQSEFGHLTSFDAMFWVTRTIGAGTLIAKRTVYVDGSVRVSQLRQLLFDIGPGTGYPLGGMSQNDWLEDFPVEIQVLIPDFQSGTMTVLDGAVRSGANPGNWQATSIAWSYGQNGEQLLVLGGAFNPGAPVAMVLNGHRVLASAMQIGFSQVIIHTFADPYFAMIGYQIGVSPEVVVEQNGYCTTTQLPLLNNQKG